MARTLLILSSSLVVFAFGLLTVGCTTLVNRFAFHPLRSPPLANAALPASVTVAIIPTDDGEKLECLLVEGSDPKKLILYFHGNAGNIAQRLPELRKLADTTGARVLGVGYRGFGASTGRPTETGLYRDGAAALLYATETLGYRENRMFICGRSIGTTVATHTARGRAVAGVILITPLTTGREMARAHGMTLTGPLVGAAFDNLSRAPRIVAPVLIVHGTADEVIPFSMGEQLHRVIASPKRFVTIAGGRHNDLELTSPQEYWSAVADFVAHYSP